MIAMNPWKCLLITCCLAAWTASMAAAGNVTPAVVNQGPIIVVNRDANFVTTLDNSGDSARIFAGNAGLNFFGGLNNTGHVHVGFGTNTELGPIDNMAGGDIAINGDSSFLVHGDVVNDATIRIGLFSSAVFQGNFSGAFGTVGPGTVDLDGGLQPGDDPAEIHFGGDTNFGPTLHTVMELGGTVAGTGYDKVDIGGHLHFGGTLDVQLFQGFQPAAGETFDLFDWCTAGGTFRNVNLPELAPGLAWDTSHLYVDGTISVISLVPEPASWLMAAVGALLLVAYRKRTRR
jgi:hypothetical protein